MAGNVTSTDSSVSGNAALRLDGAGNQLIDTSGGADLFNGDIRIDKTAGTVSLALPE